MSTRLRALWRNRRWRWFIIGGLVVAWQVVKAILASMPVVQVTQANLGPLELTIAASGQVDGEAVDLSFGTTGTVERFYAREGDPVSAGAIVARLRLDGLGTVGIASSPDDEVITAPWAGRVVQIYRHEGATVQPGLPVLRLVRGEASGVVAYLDAEDAGWLRVGQEVTVRAGGFLARPWTATVASVGAEAVQREDVPGSSKQVRVRLRVASGGFDLPVGAAVDVDGKAPMLDRALLIPAGAVTKDGDSTYVWRVVDSRLQRTTVVTGPTNLRQIAIRSGLSEGDQVVMESTAGPGYGRPKDALRDGQRVRPRPWANESQP